VAGGAHSSPVPRPAPWQGRAAVRPAPSPSLVPGHERPPPVEPFGPEELDELVPAVNLRVPRGSRDQLLPRRGRACAVLVREVGMTAVEEDERGQGPGATLRRRRLSRRPTSGPRPLPAPRRKRRRRARGAPRAGRRPTRRAAARVSGRSRCVGRDHPNPPAASGSVAMAGEAPCAPRPSACRKREGVPVGSPDSRTAMVAPAAATSRRRTLREARRAERAPGQASASAWAAARDPASASASGSA
jgi:hypothetical protein